MLHADDIRPESFLLGAEDDAQPVEDAAVGRIVVPPGMDLAVAVDTLVADVHFRAEARAEDVAFKALTVNLSDLAAMGAAPLSAAVSVTARPGARSWLDAFRRGLRQAATTFGVKIAAACVGRGALVVTVEAYGAVPADGALRRSGARPGDRIYVTGALGDAGLGLAAARGEVSLPDVDRTYVLARLDRPEPRLAAGAALRGIASAAIDVSDGLVGDLTHILEQSGAGASVDVDRLPLSPVMRKHPDRTRALALAASFGDDYELCFTVPASNRAALERALAPTGCAATEIGVIEATPGLRLRFSDGRRFETGAAYDHFAG